MKIILSIKPEFVKEIIEGRKKYEYRKCIFTKEVSSVIIYSTMPVGKFVGEFSIERIESDEPDILWEKTKRYSGITKEFYDQYFKGKEKAYALKISKMKIYDTPLNPFDLISSFVAPQSFRYITDEEVHSWNDLIAI